MIFENDDIEELLKDSYISKRYHREIINSFDLMKDRITIITYDYINVIKNSSYNKYRCGICCKDFYHDDVIIFENNKISEIKNILDSDVYIDIEKIEYDDETAKKIQYYLINEHIKNNHGDQCYLCDCKNYVNNSSRSSHNNACITKINNRVDKSIKNEFETNKIIQAYLRIIQQKEYDTLFILQMIEDYKTN